MLKKLSFYALLVNCLMPITAYAAVGENITCGEAADAYFAPDKYDNKDFKKIRHDIDKGIKEKLKKDNDKWISLGNKSYPDPYGDRVASIRFLDNVMEFCKVKREYKFYYEVDIAFMVYAETGPNIFTYDLTHEEKEVYFVRSYEVKKIFFSFLFLLATFAAYPCHAEDDTDEMTCKDVNELSSGDMTSAKVAVKKDVIDLLTEDDTAWKKYNEYLTDDDRNKIVDTIIKSCSWNDSGTLMDREIDVVGYLILVDWHVFPKNPFSKH